MSLIENMMFEQHSIKERVNFFKHGETISPGFKFTNGEHTIEVVEISVCYDVGDNTFVPIFRCNLDGEPNNHYYDSYDIINMLEQENTVLCD